MSNNLFCGVQTVSRDASHPYDKDFKFLPKFKWEGAKQFMLLFFERITIEDTKKRHHKLSKTKSEPYIIVILQVLQQNFNKN